MSRCDFKSKNIFLEESLFHELLQVLLEGSAVDGLMFLAFMVGAVFLRLGEQRIVLERSQAPDPWLIFDSIEDFIDLELNGVKHFIDLSPRSEFEKRIRSACFL